MMSATVIFVTVLLYGCLIQQLDCISLAPVYWNMSNPIFKTSKNDHIIEVQLYDDIDFICPHYPAESSTPASEYYTIYMVKRSDYIHCTLGADSWMKMILNCSEPHKRRRFTILFEPYQSIPRAPEYHPGGRYYFITTSSGDEGGLGNSHHGACVKHNMKLSVQVCCRSDSIAKHQLKSNAVDQLVSPVHSDDEWISNDRTVHVLSTPVVSRAVSGAFIRPRAQRRQGLTTVSLNKPRNPVEKRAKTSLTEDDVYGLRQTGYVVYSSQTAAACRMTSLPLVLLYAAVYVCRYLTE